METKKPNATVDVLVQGVGAWAKPEPSRHTYPAYVTSKRALVLTGSGHTRYRFDRQSGQDISANAHKGHYKATLDISSIKMKEA